MWPQLCLYPQRWDNKWFKEFKVSDLECLRLVSLIPWPWGAALSLRLEHLAQISPVAPAALTELFVYIIFDVSHIVCSQKSYMDVLRCFSLPLPSCCTFCKATLYLPASATTYNKKQTQSLNPCRNRYTFTGTWRTAATLFQNISHLLKLQ